jgi:hypothetical protein
MKRYHGSFLDPIVYFHYISGEYPVSNLGLQFLTELVYMLCESPEWVGRFEYKAHTRVVDCFLLKRF